MSIKLHLVTGDRVRNINPRSCRKGWVGHVCQYRFNHSYLVRYENGEEQAYQKGNAHNFLEKVEQPQQDARQVAKALTFAARYGIGMTPDLEKAWDEMLKLCEGTTCVVHDEVQFTPKRRVLKKVRRNVITGKTQDDFVRELGHARGVQQFNIRALGTTTGQAFRVIGDAMCNPGTEIRISKVDHAKENELCSTSWTTLDKHFRAVVQTLIGDRKGFTFTPTHIVFNPIVTEEVYVE